MNVNEITIGMSVHDLDRNLQGMSTKAFVHGGKFYGQIDNGFRKQHSDTHCSIIVPDQRIPLYPPTRAKVGF